VSLWNELPIELLLEKKLKKELGEHLGRERYSDYVIARRELLENMLGEIKGKEPNLSDHGPDHIADVLTKTFELLGEQKGQLSATELYILCLSILFHDVGNFDGRKKHNQKIAKFYDLVRKKEPRFSSERAAVLAITRAHTGFCSEGSNDTLKELLSHGVFSKPVDYKPIAALLRFADELAEGPQRTSSFMQAFNKYDKDSLKYHRLANVTDYTVDRKNKRLQVDYSIHIEVEADDTITDGKIPLIDLLKLINIRISKVNEELKYCRFYCSYLQQIQEISITFKFIYKGDYLDLGLPALMLNELVIPGENDSNFCEPNHTADSIYSKIAEALGKLSAE